MIRERRGFWDEELRGIRGSSWFGESWRLNANARGASPPDGFSFNVGLRPVCGFRSVQGKAEERYNVMESVKGDHNG